jgi:urea transporter
MSLLQPDLHPRIPGGNPSALQQLGTIYASVCFAQAPWLGWLFLAATLIVPQVGVAGLLGVLAAVLCAQFLQLSSRHLTFFGYNGLLTGLALGSQFPLDLTLAGLILAGAGLTVLIGSLALDSLWRWERVSPLSLPFVLATWFTLSASQSLPTAAPSAELSSSGILPLPLGIEAWLAAMGAVFFSSHPVSGLIILSGILVLSRYLLLLAVSSYVVGTLVLSQISLGTNGINPQIVGFNCLLTSMALGGLFTVPGLASWLLAMLASALCSILAIGFHSLLEPFHLPVLALPFVVTTLLFLICLRKRVHNQTPELILEQPGLPEQTFERARLARHRGVATPLLHLRLPFAESWSVYQGVNGAHTHQPPWQHALDFYRVETECSYRGEGNQLEDYYCFGLPILAPLTGQVVSVVQHLPDNIPGQVDAQHNWGNYLLIRAENSTHVMLAHLQQNSVLVTPGTWVVEGQVIASCGNSGRSPQPHLHLHVQQGATPGEATLPFRIRHYLVDFTVGGHLVQHADFRLTGLPEENQSVRASVVSQALWEAMALPVGRWLEYEYTRNGQCRNLRLESRIDLSGQLRLHSDSGASAAYLHTGQVLAFWDRRGPADDAFDWWLLAAGLTPTEAHALTWVDSPLADLYHGALKRPWRWPSWKLFRSGLHSRYEREADALSGMWRQRGVHQRPQGLFHSCELHTQADIAPLWGVVRLLGGTENATIAVAELVALGQREDNGIPAWQADYSNRAQHWPAMPGSPTSLIELADQTKSPTAHEPT